MQTKLTLRLDQDLVEAAKSFARDHGKSLSQIVADYFAHLVIPIEPEQELPPIVRSLKGCLQGTDLDKADYRRR